MLHITKNSISNSNPLQCGFLNRKTVVELNGKKSKVSIYNMSVCMARVSGSCFIVKRKLTLYYAKVVRHV